MDTERERYDEYVRTQTTDPETGEPFGTQRSDVLTFEQFQAASVTPPVTTVDNTTPLDEAADEHKLCATSKEEEEVAQALQGLSGESVEESGRKRTRDADVVAEVEAEARAGAADEQEEQREDSVEERDRKRVCGEDAEEGVQSTENAAKHAYNQLMLRLESLADEHIRTDSDVLGGQWETSTPQVKVVWNDAFERSLEELIGLSHTMNRRGHASWLHAVQHLGIHYRESLVVRFRNSVYKAMSVYADRLRQVEK